MLIIPAVDLKNGKCVRLEQGEMRKETVFSHHPPEVAKNWESLGAEILHLIDLDGAFSGRPQNKGVIQEIRQQLHIPIQLGGGIRTLDAIEGYLNMGIDRVVIGTAAYQQPGFLAEACLNFPDRILVGIDARNGKIAIEGWTEQTSFSAVAFAHRCENEGVTAIIYTDIQRDGMLTGVDFFATQKLAQAVSIPVIASGGVAAVEDIIRLLPLAQDGVMGVIIGRALYEGKIDLGEAIRVVKKNFLGEY